MDTYEILSKHFLLQYLRRDEVEGLLDLAVTRRYKPNQVIFNKGDPGDGLLAILDGRVKIGTISAEGKEITLNILGPGDIFGEIALIDGRDRTAHAIAMTRTDLLFLRRDDFMAFLQRNPELTTRLLIILCERIRWVSEIVEDNMFLDLPGRLAKKLLGLARNFGDARPHGTRIALKLSQTDLAELIGMTRESVNKQLKTWQEEGLIAWDRGYVTIHDMDGMGRLAVTDRS